MNTSHLGQSLSQHGGTRTIANDALGWQTAVDQLLANQTALDRLQSTPTGIERFIEPNLGQPISVTEDGIAWPEDGWYEVQDANSYETISEGGRSAQVDGVVYNVINHTTGVRYEGIVVSQPVSAASSLLNIFDTVRPPVLTSLDVVAHEMVHSLDGYGNNGLDGLPTFASAEDREIFLRVRSELITEFNSGTSTLPFTAYMEYAFTNNKEFLARFSELFITNEASAQTVKAVSPELYDVLSRTYDIIY